MNLLLLVTHSNLYLKDIYPLNFRANNFRGVKDGIIG